MNPSSLTRSRGVRRRVARTRLRGRYVRRPRVPYLVPMTDVPELPEPTGADRGAWAGYIDALTRRPGWTVARLARESHTSRATIFRWKNGEVREVTTAKVRAIAEAVGDDPQAALRAASEALAPGEATRTPTADLTLFGRWLSEAMGRQSPAMDRRTLATLIKVTPGEIAGWIIGPERPTRQQVVKIAQAFGADLGETLALAGYSAAETGEAKVADYAAEVAAMLADESPLSDDDKRRLGTALDVVLIGFRPLMKRRRAS